MFDNKRPGQQLRAEDINKLKAFKDGFSIRGLGGCNVTQRGNNYLISANAPSSAQLFTTLADPKAPSPGYPKILDSPTPNTYYAQQMGTPNLDLTASGQETLGGGNSVTPPVYKYIYNMGTGYVPLGTPVLCVPYGATYIFEYYADLVVEAVTTANGSTAAMTVVNANGISKALAGGSGTYAANSNGWNLPLGQPVLCLNGMVVDAGPLVHNASLLSNITPGLSGIATITDQQFNGGNYGQITVLDPFNLGGYTGASVVVWWGIDVASNPAQLGWLLLVSGCQS